MPDETHMWLASAAFGLEGIVARELRALGAAQVEPRSPGGALFRGDAALAFEANLRLRVADRVLLVLAEGEARTFEELFQLCANIPWERYVMREQAFPVRAKCVRSQLMSPQACQSIVKKAVAQRLGSAYGADWLPETGAVCQIDVALQRDFAMICLDASGDALSRRGYRTWNGEAPLRETLAAALVALSGWRPGQPLADPCCGTGTILIEAALRALGRAPGLSRAFAMEGWGIVDKRRLSAIREEACREAERAGGTADIIGSDIDPEAVELARRHAAQAGVAQHIRLSTCDVRALNLPHEAGVFIVNPPYGERLGDRKAARAVCAQLRSLMDRHPGWRLCAFSADPGFERVFGRRADKRRRLYNGRLECDMMLFGGRRAREVTHD